jgi:ABC-type lipoprotein export system ATPase subunit
MGGMTELLVETTDLTKRYGPRAAADHIGLQVRRGEVYGFLGPNGAGKTTTLRLLLGLVRASSGTACVLGTAPGDPAELARIGMLVESPAFYPYLSGRDNLRVFARYASVPVAKVDEVLETVDLVDRAKDHTSSYSLGMKQRLGVAAALLKEPELLILDSPWATPAVGAGREAAGAHRGDVAGRAGHLRRRRCSKPAGRVRHRQTGGLAAGRCAAHRCWWGLARGRHVVPGGGVPRDPGARHRAGRRRRPGVGAGGGEPAAHFGSIVDVVDVVQRSMPGTNAGALAAALGVPVQGQPGGTPGVTDAVGGTSAALVLAAYLVMFAAASAVLIRRRDVT